MPEHTLITSYVNKYQLFLLDLLDSLPRLRLSDSQFEAILFVMKQVGGQNVPSLKTLRRLQQRLRSMSVPTAKIQTGQGNIFHINDIAKQIADVGSVNLNFTNLNVMLTLEV